RRTYPATLLRCAARDSVPRASRVAMTARMRSNRLQHAPGRSGALPRGLYYDRDFIAKGERDEILEWLATIHPIWEQRYALNHPPPPGREQRWLLRPVYWLGNWQFACLDYYHPPKGVLHRCVRAEPYPPVLRKLVARAEKIAHGLFTGLDLPAGWHLNTCLVNFYGNRIEG